MSQGSWPYIYETSERGSLEEIGWEFEIAEYSSVSSVIEKIKAMIAKDRKLKKRVVGLKEEINMSQEQTWPLFTFDRKKKMTHLVVSCS